MNEEQDQVYGDPLGEPGPVGEVGIPEEAESKSTPVEPEPKSESTPVEPEPEFESTLAEPESEPESES